jgi:uncharacterized membrane protein YczE
MNAVVVNNWVVLLRKMPSLLFGLFLFAMGVVANLYSGLGMSPWGVLSVGIAGRTPFTIGQASQVVGLVVLAIGWLLGYAPGLGTVANMYFIGLFVDEIMAWGLLPVPSDDVGRFTMLFFGVVLIGVASYLYLRVRLGAGPRDGLMMGLVKRLNRPVSIIRGAMEVTVLVVGYLLGGPVGIGTVINALTLGYSVQLAFKIGKFDPKSAEQVNLPRLIQCLSGEGSLS